jgi:hypothetical protein
MENHLQHTYTLIYIYREGGRERIICANENVHNIHNSITMLTLNILEYTKTHIALCFGIGTRIRFCSFK